MGFFGKVKQNLEHGGVKVELQSPESISGEELSIPVSVTVSSTSQPATINKIRVELFDRYRANMGTAEDIPTTIATAENLEAFVLQPNQSQTVQLNIVLRDAPVDPDSINTKIHTSMGMVNLNPYLFMLHATADVEGIAIDPQAQNKINVEKPYMITESIGPLRP